MNTPLSICKRLIVAAALFPAAIISLRAADGTTAADQPVRLDEIEVRSSRASAITQAPTQSNLGVLQPQSVISLQFISNHMAPTADYATIANMAPSVSNVETNGPGLSESKHLTLRGFDDAQYNVTYDGIPFGDTNDFSHHSTSYFPAKMIGRVIVDRGPGTASTVGEATFGGTIALFSKDPRLDAALIPTVSYGSYNTSLIHIEANTGLLPSMHGASIIGSYQYMKTDGRQTNADMWRHTTYVKYLQPIGHHTTLTFLSNYNNIKFNKTGKITQAQIDTLGRDYGLGSDPTKTDYFGYNYQTKQTDFEYIGLRSDLGGGWVVDNKIYTYYYNNQSHEKAKIGTKASPTNMGGRMKLNRFRATGDYFVASHVDAMGTLKVGGWTEHQWNTRNRYHIDYGLGGAFDLAPGELLSDAYDYDMHDSLNTYQLFADYSWHAARGLRIEPGVKYVNFGRGIDAPINEHTGTPLKFKKTYKKTLGYLSANYTLSKDWATYAQVAQGFLAPNLNFFYVPDPSKNQIKPQETMNYQWGTVFKTDRLNADADVYYIDYKNYPVTRTDPVTLDPIYMLASGARFSGIEAEATYHVGDGVSLYANGSINRGKYKKSDLDVDVAPRSTASFGVLYNEGGFFGSIIDKYVGRSVIYQGSFNPDVASSVTAAHENGGYSMVDLALGYGRKLQSDFWRSFKVKLQVNNIFDKKENVIDSIKKGVNYYNTLPGRNYFVTVSGVF